MDSVFEDEDALLLLPSLFFDFFGVSSNSESDKQKRKRVGKISRRGHRSHRITKRVTLRGLTRAEVSLLFLGSTPWTTATFGGVFLLAARPVPLLSFQWLALHLVRLFDWGSQPIRW